MSKRESISRYTLIIKKLRRNPASFEEISDFLEMESEIQGYNFNVSKRTFQRDLNDIRSIYNIDIEFNPHKKVYEIVYDENSEANERLLEAFDTLNAMNIASKFSGYVSFEKRKPARTEHLFGMLHAIRNNFQIKFLYQKYEDDDISERHCEPYALKEFNHRWYVVAKDYKDDIIKTFGLDRLSALDITTLHFSKPDFDVKKHFKNCFGIYAPTPGDKVQKIVLSFEPWQGKYIKSLPIHESQKIITETDKELVIEMTLYVTFDLIQEVLSHGKHVKVIEPQELIDEIKKHAVMDSMYK
jgi:predicted DNA-binding transcriptional regulator YafY